MDISRRRLSILRENYQRLGITNIRPATADVTRRLSTLCRARFDKIMVDAPCSGFGVLSRHPDGKWNKDPKSLINLAKTQTRILNEATPLLKVGGKILYVVCTMSREENEGVVERYLEAHGYMALLDIRDYLPIWGQGLVDDQGYFRTFPHIQKMDGFFAALFIKKEPEP